MKNLKNKKEAIIPEQQTGAFTDTKATVEFSTVEDAKRHFEDVKQRLLRISDWPTFSGKALAGFQLKDEAGKPLDRPAKPGDFLSIDIPGPGIKTGEGTDWVRIEDIESQQLAGDYEHLAIKVRPTSSPLNEDPDTAHFFNTKATSSFLVKREKNIVSAEVHGRNEEPNTEMTNTTDAIRNVLVSVGAMLGFSKLQWKSLVEGLVRKDKK